MVGILGANSVRDSGYNISNSLMFDAGSSAHLSRTLADSNERTWTWSGWFKNCIGANELILLRVSPDDDTIDNILVSSSGTIQFQIRRAPNNISYINTNQVLRDPSAWYHLVVAYDVTQSTNTDRVKIYLNGNQITSFQSSSYPDQNYDAAINGNSEHVIGEMRETGGAGTRYSDFYLTETHFIDGTAKAQTDFGEFNDNGVWIPIKYTGTYGTNGFYLEFQQTGTSANSSGIGADTSGQDNHFTSSGLAATDVTTDTCTNNFCTLNPLFRSNFDNDGTYAEGNCERDFTADNANRGYGFASFGVTSGKWYWEVKIPTVARANTGIGDVNAIAGFSGVMYDQNPSKGFMINYNGQIEENATATSYASSLSDNDIVMWALDMDNHRAYYGINGTWQDSGDPTSGSTGTGDVTTQISDQSHLNTGEPMFPFCFDASTSGQSQFQWNFGNPIHSISSGNTDGKYGNFEYAPPSGYYALCTKRLAEFG